MGAEGCQGSRGRRSSTEQRRDSEYFGGGGRGRIGSGAGGGCAARVAMGRRGARGPKDADRPRDGGGTLKISAAAAAGVGSGAGAGGGCAARVAMGRRGARGPDVMCRSRRWAWATPR